MPADDWYLSILSFEAVYLTFSFAYVENFDSLILTACEEPISVDWIPSNLVDCIVMCGYRVHSFSTSSRIPYFDMVVFTPSDYQWLRWMPVTRPDVWSMIREDQLLLRGCEVKHDCSTIIWAWHELKWAFREAKISYAILMCFKLILLVHFGIGINYISFLVSWNEKFIVFWECNSLDSVSMYGACCWAQDLSVPRQYFTFRCPCD